MASSRQACRSTTRARTNYATISSISNSSQIRSIVSNTDKQSADDAAQAIGPTTVANVDAASAIGAGYDSDDYEEGDRWDWDRNDPKQYCKHGTFIGSWWGPDLLCGRCEMGDD